MASRSPQVKIVFAGDATGLTKALGDVGGAGDGLSSKMGSLSGVIGKAAGAFAGLMAVREVGVFLKESAVAAMEDAKGQEILHTAIRNTTNATDKQLSALDQWISKTQAATGFTEEELRPAMVKLTTATKDVGKAQELMGIAMDAATARGVSLETVTNALEKAQNGNVAGLQRLGIATKDASGAALSYDQILRNMQTAYGGATAAAADTMAGKMERMKLVFGEMKETLGAALLPIIEKFASFIMENMPVVEGIFKAIGAVIAGLMPIAQMVFDFMAEMIAAITELWESHGRELMAKIQPIWEAIKGIIEAGMKVIGGVIKLVMALISGDWSMAWDAIKGIAEGIWNLIKNVVSLALKVIKELLSLALEGYKALWSAAWNGIKAAGEFIWGGIKAGLSAVWNAIKDAFGKLWDGMKAVWDAAADWIRSIPDKIKGFFVGAAKWLWDIGKSIIEGLWNGLKAAWDKVAGWFSGLGSKIKNLKGPMSKDRVMLFDEGQAIISGLARGMQSAFPLVEKTLGSLSASIPNTIGVKASVTGSGQAQQSQDRGPTYITINVSGTSGASVGQEIADALIAAGVA